jgi:hypothetical protein
MVHGFNNPEPSVLKMYTGAATHGGYFEGVLSQQLIYRLACLGYDDTIKIYGTEQKLGEICKGKKIRMLVSPALSGSAAGAVPSATETPS